MTDRMIALVPGSGGKDSAYTAHILKYKYGMNPLCTTWSPIIYTDYGYENYKNWIELGGFDNVHFKQNGRAMKILTKLAIENLLHPFQTFILGQKNLAPKIANNFGIDLVFMEKTSLNMETQLPIIQKVLEINLILLQRMLKIYIYQE